MTAPRYDVTVPGGRYERHGQLVDAHGGPIVSATPTALTDTTDAAKPSTVKELRARLEELGIEAPKRASKADLEALIVDSETNADGDESEGE